MPFAAVPAMWSTLQHTRGLFGLSFDRMTTPARIACHKPDVG
jgi:hypothetical protein